MNLRRCVIAGQASFTEFCCVVSDLISVWESVREHVRYTGPPQLQTGPERACTCVLGGVLSYVRSRASS